MKVVIHQRYQKFPLNHKSYIFQMKSQCCYVSTTRCRFGKVIKNATNMSQHEALKSANVHEMTLCVTFFARHFRTDLRFFTASQKYTVIHMLWGTHVRQTTLCVTFGARPRSIPSVVLDNLVGHLGRQGRPRPPKDSGMVPPSDRLGCQSRPGMPSRPYLGAPALTSKPPVGYLS